MQQAHRRRHRRPARVRTRARRLPPAHHRPEAHAPRHARADHDDRVREHRDDALAGAGDGPRRAHAPRRADRARGRDVQRSSSPTRASSRARCSSSSPPRRRCASGCPARRHRVQRSRSCFPTGAACWAGRPTRTRSASRATTPPPPCTSSGSAFTPEQVEMFARRSGAPRGRPSRVPARDHARRRAARRRSAADLVDLT